MQTLERAGTVQPVHKPRRPAPWPIAFWRSAVGKKWVMALTGIMIMGFVFIHMVGNLHLYQGAHHMNEYGEFLREILVPILPRTVFLWIMRLGLITAFVLHIWAAASLTRMNWTANAEGYKQTRDWQAASAASRSMRYTGIVILLFLAWHLADFTWGWVNPSYIRGDVYGNVSSSFKHIVPVIIYVFANVALGLHLYHGAWSMFQSLGVNNPRYNALRRRFAIGFAAIVCIGNLSFPRRAPTTATSSTASMKRENRSNDR
jgi:succinate dehydrogenase / fumarate reductase cytochrome b subunit